MGLRRVAPGTVSSKVGPQLSSDRLRAPSASKCWAQAHPSYGRLTYLSCACVLPVPGRVMFAPVFRGVFPHPLGTWSFLRFQQ